MSLSNTQHSALVNSAISEATDKVKIGPGSWAFIHIISFYAEGYEGQLAAARQIKIFLENFPCINPCRNDALAYWDRNPGTNHVHGLKALFAWSVEFHNYVNTKLRKPRLEYKDALIVWGPSAACRENCGEKAGAMAGPASAPGPNSGYSEPPSAGFLPKTPIGPLAFNVTVRPMSPPRSRPASPPRTNWVGGNW